MPPTEPEKRRLMLERGSVVILHPDGPAGGFPRHDAVDHVRDGLHWFRGSCAPLEKGEQLLVEYAVPADARYLVQATIAARSEQTFALEVNELWERAQEREFVRISTHGLLVRITRADDSIRATRSGDRARENGPGDASEDAGAPCYPLLDLSAGGIRFRSTGEWFNDDAVVCHVELPGIPCFVIAGRIVRTLEGASVLKKPEVAVEFEGLSDELRGELLRWVYREQVNRHHDAIRRAKQTP